VKEEAKDAEALAVADVVAAGGDAAVAVGVEVVVRKRTSGSQ
jgi:hypothetical protein